MTPSQRPRLVHDAEGLNTAGDPATVALSHVTAVDDFYTRSHAPPPTIDPTSWRLTVDGLVARELRLSLDDLRAFRHREVTATLLCAGLRRDELLQVAPLPGELPWGPEPAATARWLGVSLADVLEAAGVRNDAQHIGFTGLDAVTRHGSTFGFGGSISIDKARDADVLLAFAQNGEPLRAAHGFPVRVIVPGWVGARSVKWLGRITALREPSENYFQTRAYRVQHVVNPADPTDVTQGEPITEVSLTAVVLTPASGSIVSAGEVTLRGWAIGASGAPVTRVEYSLDDGLTWTAAAVAPERARWSWTMWSATLPLTIGAHSFVVRAHDTTGIAQPSRLDDVWNAKGYMNNSWHRVHVTAV